ncbi:hypothetical protein [Pseudoalteromonas sp. G4]|uniref:hypothetical protein n=1 Tax=Pseudoalteromonas sp. G4 TaxID=2992761 RepID=UPI00237E6D4F|nr:hypothetical protein [Pseudoalteromonas sp. G4]MDE3273981.1 hypothetical protein [Pseudoalteromonas sp. G4]
MKNGILIVAEHQEYDGSNHTLLVDNLFERAKSFNVSSVFHCAEARLFGYFEGAEEDISPVVACIFQLNNYEVIFHLIVSELQFSPLDGCYLLNFEKMSPSIKFNAVVLESAIDKYVNNLYSHEDAVDIALFSIKKLRRLMAVTQ